MRADTISIAAKDRQALAIAYQILARGCAAARFHERSVLIGMARNVARRTAFEQCRAEWTGSLRRNGEKATRTAPFRIGLSSPVFDLPVDVEHVSIAPVVVAGFLCKEI